MRKRVQTLGAYVNSKQGDPILIPGTTRSVVSVSTETDTETEKKLKYFGISVSVLVYNRKNFSSVLNLTNVNIYNI